MRCLRLLPGIAALSQVPQLSLTITNCGEEEKLGTRPFEAISAFRNKLSQGNNLPLVGIGIQLADPTSSDALAPVSDFLWYDQEHTPLSPEMLKWHIFAAHGRGCPVIVRVPGPNVATGSHPWGTWIKQALDMNADGIVVPQIRTPEDVRAIVSDCRYPRGGSRNPPYNIAEPHGTPGRLHRGFGPTTPMDYGRLPLKRYLDLADAGIFVAVMIETVEAVDNIDEICSVPGLDCVVLGANDLSASLGVPYDGASPVTQAAVDKIIAAAKRHGKAIFFSTRDLQMAERLVAKGCQILHVGSDVLAATTYQTKIVQQIKQKLR